MAARMMKHTVEQGEHLSGVAEKYGFRDFRTIWDYAENAKLKSARGNAHVLYPGDTLVIPEKTPKTLSAETDKHHRYRVAVKPLMLRIALKDYDNEPIATMKCVLTVGGATYNLTTDANGKIETPIPKDAREGMLKVPDLDLELPVKIGYLDPHVEDTGWKARLINLGYYAGAVGDTEDDRMRHAIEEFQCDHKLKVTGALDDATRAKLKQEHGA
jgi:putative peptidoglycan binding protein